MNNSNTVAEIILAGAYAERTRIIKYLKSINERLEINPYCSEHEIPQGTGCVRCSEKRSIIYWTHNCALEIEQMKHMQEIPGDDL